MDTVERKTCGRCGLDKPIEEFGFRYPKLGIRHSWCRDCFVEYKHAWYVQRRERHIAYVREQRDRTADENQLRLWEYLALHPCVDCGERDPVVLQFDHLRDKRESISYMARSGFAWTTILEEMSKCEVRCANCHFRKTARERGLYDRKHAVLHTVHLPEVDVPHNCWEWAVSSVDRAPVF